MATTKNSSENDIAIEEVILNRSQLVMEQSSVSLVQKDHCYGESVYNINDYVRECSSYSGASDFDEAELKRQLLRDFDPEGFGEIRAEEFLNALKTNEFIAQVPINKRELLTERIKNAQSPIGTGYITFQDFVNIMSGKRTHSFKCAVHQRDCEVYSEENFYLRPEDVRLFEKVVHVTAVEMLPDKRDRRYYEDRYTCCPPPWFIMLITIVELILYGYHLMVVSGKIESAPLYSLLIYRPDRRHEIWRFVTYMLLHMGWFHLAFNLLIQLLLGLPLEMIHGAGRIAAIYIAGVLAGSLGTSIMDPEVSLIGASGGVYALLAAHLANVLINYHQMRYGISRLALILFIASCDVGFAVYTRYSHEQPESSISFIAHLTGALAGLTFGLLVLKNFEQRLHEQLLWWIMLGIYGAFIIFSIVFNIWRSNLLLH